VATQPAEPGDLGQHLEALARIDTAGGAVRELRDGSSPHALVQRGLFRSQGDGAADFRELR
jgi:hypothetical protein